MTTKNIPTATHPIVIAATARLSAAHEAARAWCHDRNAESGEVPEPPLLAAAVEAR